MKPNQELSFPLKVVGSGETKTYEITPLRGKDAVIILHKTIKPVLKSIAAIPRGRNSMDRVSNAAEAFLDALDPEELWDIGEKMLAFAVIDGEEIKYEKYFGENPTEHTAAVVKCVMANYPEVFQMLQQIKVHAMQLLQPLWDDLTKGQTTDSGEDSPEESNSGN